MLLPVWAVVLTMGLALKMHSQVLLKDDHSEEVKNIQGSIKLNGQLYKTLCVCEDAKPGIGKGKCNTPARTRVHQEQHNKDKGMDKEELKSILGPANKFSLLDLDAKGVTTVDARNPSLAIAVPGGELVEFVLAVSEFEKYGW